MNEILMKRYHLLQLVSTMFLGMTTVSGQLKEHTQIVTVRDFEYEIEVGGSRAPVNETIVIENLGDQALVNPRITVDGRYDWFDVEAIAREATRGCSTDEEKALAIWDFIRLNFDHLASPGDRECHNPVIAMNVYGYANCAYHSTVFTSLCRAVGIPARVYEVWHHTVSEAYYNNAWHMLDSDIGLYYLSGDNRSIASVEQLWEDQRISGGKESGAALTAFSGRNKAVRAIYTDVEGKHPYLSQDGKKIRGYRYYFGPSECFISTGYDRFTYEEHDMSMTLRPGEKLIRNWKGGDKYYDYKRHDRNLARGQKEAKPFRYGDGQLIWKPDLKSELAPSFFNTYLAPGFQVKDGQSPAIHVRHKHGGIYDFPERAILSVKTPYTILGGTLKARLYRGGCNEWDRLTAKVYSPTGPVIEQVWSAPEGTSGTIDAKISLDELLFPSGERGRHAYHVEFGFMADEGNDPPTQSGMEEVELITDIQVCSNSLPALHRGRNVVRYRDETPGVHKVKITHIWTERTDNNPPDAPARAIFPKEGEHIATLAPLFRWEASPDADKADKITNYNILISFDPECRWPIATALHKETDSGVPEFQLPEGWLNKNSSYYWKVRAQDSRGEWSEWSEIYRFKTE
ncbi:MAG: hypothetical protein CSA96_09670 [Bacteroidetes bacterium]|nr:MAG: hypothetical protein CSA96_09670 [Bacteroidota bacterium]